LSILTGKEGGGGTKTKAIFRGRGAPQVGRAKCEKHTKLVQGRCHKKYRWGWT